jgi:hypothetical protein
VSLYRWHERDPYVFESGLRVDVQQLGYIRVAKGSDFDLEGFARKYPPAGSGWHPGTDMLAVSGLAERTDDVCATVYYYADRIDPQARPRLSDVIGDVVRIAGEQPTPMEMYMTSVLRG